MEFKVASNNMDPINEDEIYDYKSTDYVNIKCFKCNTILYRKVNSIRSNVKKNKKYMCQSCVQNSSDYRSKQHEAHYRGGREKWSEKVGVKCSLCGKEYEVTRRHIRYCGRMEKDITCQRCAMKEAYKDGRMSKAFEYAKSAENIERLKECSNRFWNENRGRWKSTYMKHLLEDSNYTDLMSKYGKLGAYKLHINYRPPIIELSDNTIGQIDWNLTYEKFGIHKNSVPHDAKLMIKCIDCNEIFGINYKTIKKCGGRWRCFGCMRRLEIKELNDLPLMDVDINKVNTKEFVKVRCDGCGNIESRILSSILRIYRTNGEYNCLKCSMQRTYNKTANDRKKKFIDDASKIYDYDYSKVDYINNKTKVNIICKEHGGFVVQPHAHLYGSGCPICSISMLQRDIYNFIDTICCDNKIINDRSEISPLELDIFMPDRHLAIECHGIYWHSFDQLETKEEKFRHATKSDRCGEKGIYLIQIFENEWRDKRPIIESIIRNKFDASDRIYARKCEIIEVDTGDYRDFMNINHLQGYKHSNVAFGLRHAGNVVCIMSFNKHNKYGWEITRFANKLNVSVVGGASRLFKHFLAKYKPDTVLSYADRRFSDGGLYKSLGFDMDGVTQPNYFYVMNNELLSRHKFQKHKLRGQLQIFNESLSESENMFLNGFRRLWDSGHWRFIWKSDKCLMRIGQR